MKLTALCSALVLCLSLLATPVLAGSVICKSGDVFASFSDMSSPFGTKMGMPGDAFPELRQKEVTSLETYVVRTVPAPAEQFDLYLLTFEDDGRIDGLSSISGAVIFRKGMHGLAEFFVKQTDVFQKSFGDPDIYLNKKWVAFLKEKRPECDELMEALAADPKQSFVAVWNLKGRKDGIKRVQVQFFPQSRNQCLGVASFYFENYK